MVWVHQTGLAVNPNDSGGAMKISSERPLATACFHFTSTG
jgi:hypothetical protein